MAARSCYDHNQFNSKWRRLEENPQAGWVDGHTYIHTGQTDAYLTIIRRRPKLPSAKITLKTTRTKT